MLLIDCWQSSHYGYGEALFQVSLHVRLRFPSNHVERNKRRLDFAEKEIGSNFEAESTQRIWCKMGNGHNASD